MWGRRGELCLGGVSASGCVSLSIPRFVSSCPPIVPAGMGGNIKEGGPAVINKQVLSLLLCHHLHFQRSCMV